MKKGKRITKLTDEMVGKSCSCKIYSKVVDDCRIQKEGSTFYLCQNVVCRSSPLNRLGYDFGYSLGSGDKSAFTRNKVTGFYLTARSTSLLETTLVEGDILQRGKDECEVIAVLGRAVIIQYDDGSPFLSTYSCLNNLGYTLKVEEEEEEIEELTMAEVCKLLGREVKIKK